MIFRDLTSYRTFYNKMTFRDLTSYRTVQILCSCVYFFDCKISKPPSADVWSKQTSNTRLMPDHMILFNCANATPLGMEIASTLIFLTHSLIFWSQLLYPCMRPLLWSDYEKCVLLPRALLCFRLLVVRRKVKHFGNRANPPNRPFANYPYVCVCVVLARAWRRLTDQPADMDI